MGRRTFEVKIYLSCKRIPEKVVFYSEDELKDFLNSVETEKMLVTDNLLFRTDDVKFIKYKSR